MALTAELQKFSDTLSCCTYNGAQHTHVLIEEHDVSATLRKVTLIAGGGDWFSFCPDKGRGKASLMSPLFAVGNGHDHHRACDNVTIINQGGRLRVLYIDLKSSTKPEGYSSQFRSTRQFVRYAIGVLEDLYSTKFILAEERFVILHGGGKAPLLNKTPTVPKRVKIGSTQPDKPHKRPVSDKARLYLNELLA